MDSLSIMREEFSNNEEVIYLLDAVHLGVEDAPTRAQGLAEVMFTCREALEGEPGDPEWYPALGIAAALDDRELQPGLATWAAARAVAKAGRDASPTLTRFLQDVFGASLPLPAPNKWEAPCRTCNRSVRPGAGLLVSGPRPAVYCQLHLPAHTEADRQRLLRGLVRVVVARRRILEWQREALAEASGSCALSSLTTVATSMSPDTDASPSMSPVMTTLPSKTTLADATSMTPGVGVSPSPAMNVAPSTVVATTPSPTLEGSPSTSPPTTTSLQIATSSSGMATPPVSDASPSGVVAASTSPAVATSPSCVTSMTPAVAAMTPVVVLMTPADVERVRAATASEVGTPHMSRRRTDRSPTNRRRREERLPDLLGSADMRAETDTDLAIRLGVHRTTVTSMLKNPKYDPRLHELRQKREQESNQRRRHLMAFETWSDEDGEDLGAA